MVNNNNKRKFGKPAVNSNHGSSAKRLSLQKVRSHIPYYIMLLPGIIYFIIYKFYPMYGAVIAFKDFNMLDGILKSPWADPWYKHFATFFNSPYCVELLTNTLEISLVKIILGTFSAIILALLVNECRKSWLKKIVQTVSFMPYFLSWVVIYGIAFAFFSEGSGIINKVIEMLGGEAIPFFTSNSYFRYVLYGTHVWHGVGYSAVVYLASIVSIDTELYEAATVDGAGRLRRIWHITLPGIRSTIITLFIINIGNILNAGFDQIFVMYNEQVYSSADIIDTWVYRTGLVGMNYELGSAVGLFKSVLGFFLVYITNRLARKWGEQLW